MAEQETQRKLLQELRQALEETARASAGSREPVELDQTRVGRLSRMDAMQGQAMSQELERRRKLELVRIDAALERVKAGDYGYCASCDEPIAPKRLELDPAAPLCIACARKAEQ